MGSEPDRRSYFHREPLLPFAAPIHLPQSPPLGGDSQPYHDKPRKCHVKTILCFVLATFAVAGLFKHSAVSIDSAWPLAKSHQLPIRYSQAASQRMVKHKLHQVQTTDRRAAWRDNLLPGHKYITAGTIGGTANQFHGLTNLLYLAAQTRRVALLPSLEAGWVPGGALARFSDFWDLERYTITTGNPVLEWSDIRNNITSTVQPKEEYIGCWSSNEVMDGSHYKMNTLFIHNLDMDHWPMPPTVKLHPEYQGALPFGPLVDFDLEASARQDWLDHLRQSDRRKVFDHLRKNGNRTIAEEGAIEPNDQLMCYDNIFHLHTLVPQSPAFDASKFGDDRGSWEATGQHMHWNKIVDDRTDDILTTRLGDALQPYIAIHLRRNDFGKDKPLQHYIDALELLYDQMLTPEYAETAGISFGRFNPRTLPVFALTDENDPVFLASLSKLGWVHYDHVAEKTAERYGAWWPSVLDAAILSRGHGVVGTTRSTYSYQGILRAQAWQGAAYVWA